MSKVLYFRCNRSKIFVSEWHLLHGVLRLVEDTSGDQCEGCGEDIIEKGEVQGSRRLRIQCTNCFTRYDIIGL